MKPIARIALRGEPPAELIAKLSLLNLDPFGAGALDSDLVAVFARRAMGGWVVHPRHDRALAAAPRATICENPLVAAAFLLSSALRLPEPLLCATDEGFAILRDAVTLAAGGANILNIPNILITGETGTGKKSLATLIHRASGPGGGETRVDCADARDFERALLTLCRAHRKAPVAPRTIVLERIGELAPAHQEELTRVMRARLSARYIATVKTPPEGLIPSLIRQFDATVAVPPLRCRPLDIDMLARHFLCRVEPRLELGAAALEAIHTQPLPGNVRELRNLMVRLSIHLQDEAERIITPAQIARQCLCVPPSAPQGGPDPTPITSVPRIVHRRHLRLVVSANRARPLRNATPLKRR
jgi:hypothetical protein